jgi:signal recognition particle subunit SRP54
MAFEGLADKLQNVFKKLTGRGMLNEQDVKAAMREVKLALLEADVNFKVVKDFINAVTEKAVGQDVLKSLTPGQQVVKIVNDEMTELLGGKHKGISFSQNIPTVIMMCGLQGAGKTTMCGKLALSLKKQGKTCLLTACDIYRPAAIKQLQIVAGNAGAPFFEMGQAKPAAIAKAAIKEAEKKLYDVVILDTAGRLHIDDEMMEELIQVKKAVSPHETLLVVDAMTGQDAVNAATAFNERIGLDGIILTKLDGDTRGGAALSVKAVTGKPVKFAGIGEKLSDIEPFHPERMASRILGMGDVLTLIEKAEGAFEAEKAAKLEKKLRTEQLTLEDFLEQMEQLKNMGSIGDILSMLPGGAKLSGMDLDEKQMARTEAIVKSMTREERLNPDIINGSRRKRIAAGSGTKIQDVNRLLNQFEQMKKMLKQFSGKHGKRGMFNLPRF